MKFRTLIIGFFALFLTASVMMAQEVKIGYTNIELVLAYMPEARQMESTLQTYQKKLGEQLQTKEKYAMGKLEEYQTGIKNNTMSPEKKAAAEQELQKLDQEIQAFAQESEYNLLAKREELLQPIVEKLQKAIDETAESKGFTYILNQTTSAGVSTILFGPEENDITEDLMKKLGIEIPKEDGSNK